MSQPGTTEPRRIKLPPGSVLPVDSASEAKGMLPGMAMIAIFMLFYALINVFAAWRGAYGNGIVRTVALCICTLFVVGIFGFLRLRRWGWALVTGGALFLSMYDVLQFIRAHVGIARGGSVLVQAAFAMVFFLYLVRTEIRDRVH
jgi:hypothetical protein